MSPAMRFGVPLGLVHPGIWRELAVEADRLGFESVWLPEHLVFATDLSTATYPGTSEPGIAPHTPLFDAPAYLCALAAVTVRIRLGTAVHLFGLRHPIVSARAFATLDQISGGRAIVGVGAGWYEGEWIAAGVDFATRGRRLDEAITVARRLWTESVVEHQASSSTSPRWPSSPSRCSSGCTSLLVVSRRPHCAGRRRSATAGSACRRRWRPWHFGWRSSAATAPRPGEPESRSRSPCTPTSWPDPTRSRTGLGSVWTG
jgi:luciferase-like monooxygenase